MKTDVPGLVNVTSTANFSTLAFSDLFVTYPVNFGVLALTSASVTWAGLQNFTNVCGVP